MRYRNGCLGKQRQVTEEVAKRNAENATKEAKVRYGKRARRIGYYHCKVCGYHHLTSHVRGGKH